MVVGEFTQETDLVVIGGGPGGYSAAFRAAELGQSVIIVHTRNALGGVCLHEGCVPSKTLLNIADVINSGLDAGKFGIEFSPPSINHDLVRSWTNKTIETLASGLESLSKKHDIDRIQGRAYFEDSRILHILDGSIPRVRFRRAIIATGTQPVSHAALPFDGEFVLSPDQAATLPSVPGKLLIIGSDYLAVEMACIYTTLGSRVWLVAEDDRLLPEADKDIVRPLQRSLADKLEGLHLNWSSENSEADKSTVTFSFEGNDVPEQKTFDAVIVSRGRKANLSELKLEKTDVTLDEDGFITIDDQMRTSDARIHGVGDVTGPPLLANKAIHQGRICAEVIAGRSVGFDAQVFPMVVHTDPHVAWCGMSSAGARADDLDFAVLRIAWGASGLATGMGRTDGMTKLIYEKTSGAILGVAMTGVGAGEMIAEAALALALGAVVADPAATLHPHPSRRELLSVAPGPPVPVA